MTIIKFLRKPYLSIILAAITLLTSCSQYDNGLNDNELNGNNKINLTNLNFNELIEQQQSFLYEYHNNNVSKKSNNSIENFDKNKLGSFIEDELASISKYDYDLRYLDNQFSEEANLYLSNLMILVDEFEDTDKFTENTNKLVNEIRTSSIDEYEKNVLIGTIEITKNSTIYYAPSELGGLQNKSQYLSRKGWSWKRAAKGAAAGSMTFFLGVGLTIIAPPAGAAVLTAWAWSAAAGAVVGGSGIVKD